jgi:hypothetical protein
MEMAVRLMTAKEISVVRAKANYAYDAAGLCTDVRTTLPACVCS